MAAVKEQVAGVLLGSSPDISHQARSLFYKHAKKDDETGEVYMSETEFINAVAPASEDYVRDMKMPCLRRVPWLISCFPSVYSTKSKGTSIRFSFRWQTAETREE